MDDDNYYVRFTEDIGDQNGELVAFPKSILNDIQALAGMQEDLGNDLGTRTNPFALFVSNVPITEFRQLTSLIKHIKNMVGLYPELNNPYKIHKLIWELIAPNYKNYYPKLARLIFYGDYLGINPMIMEALTLCLIYLPYEKEISRTNGTVVTKEPETLDISLESGLTEINQLPPDTLLNIKSRLIENIQLEAESFLMETVSAPETNHPKITLNVKPEVKPLIITSKVFSKTRALFKANTHDKDIGILIFDTPKTNHDTVSTTTTTKVLIPHYKFLGEFPHKDLMSEKVKSLDIRRTASPTNADNMYMVRAETYGTYNFYYTTQDTLINVCHIGSITYKKWISIPNNVYHITSFKDPKNQEQFICILGSPIDNNKIIIINPVSEEVETIETPPNSVITAACVYENLYIYSSQNKQTGIVTINICDLFNENKLTIRNQLTDNNLIGYSELFASYTNGYIFQIFGVVSSPKNHYIDRFFINRKTLTIENTSEKRDIESKFYETVQENALPSKIVILDLTHPDIKNLNDINIIHDNGTIYIGGLAIPSRDFSIFEWIPNHALTMIEAIKELVTCNIEQLYAIGEIMHRLDIGTFTEMSKKEKEIVATLADKQKNLLLNIIDWQLKGIYETPTHDITDTQSKTTKDTPQEEQQTKEPNTDKKSPKDQ